MYSVALQKEIISLAREGVSNSELHARFDVPKSTISTWIKNAVVPRDRTRQLQHLERMRLLSAETKHLQRQERLTFAQETALSIAQNVPSKSIDINKALLAMLYWAEGTKSNKPTGLTFANTDPLLAKFYLTLLRNSYQLDESRIRVRIHLHDYHSQAEALSFWSNLLNVPSSQFGKIYVKKRSTQKKFRENFQGICFIRYGNEAIRQELMALGREIAANHMLSSFNG